MMPPMSRTEKEAIDAGTTWWEGDLFQGKPDWKKLHNYPQPRLTAEEQAFLDGPVEEACRMANSFQITHELADLPPELWAYLKQHRFFAMIIKKEYVAEENNFVSALSQSLVNDLKMLDVNTLTPIECMQKLDEIVKQAKEL